VGHSDLIGCSGKAVSVARLVRQEKARHVHRSVSHSSLSPACPISADLCACGRSTSGARNAAEHAHKVWVENSRRFSKHSSRSLAERAFVTLRHCPGRLTDSRHAAVHGSTRWPLCWACRPRPGG
jgi:hypothetical protein